MRNTSNVVFGGVLLAVGAIWLMRSLDLFDFYWSDLFNFWYWYLIVAGLLLIISGVTHNRAASSMAGIFITLSIVGGVTKGIHREFRNFTPFEWRSDRNDGESRESRRERKRKQKSGELVKGDFGYDMKPGLRDAKFNFAGGAGSFTIEGATGRLFEAKTSSTFVNYISNFKHNTADQKATVDFKMEEGDIDLDHHDGDNTVNIQLNDSIRWDVDLKFGAGEGKFDFSKNVIEKLYLKSGAADVKIKLGDKATNSEVDIRAGVASVEIEVPKTAAVEIYSRGALSSTEFPGFEQSGKNRYRSPGYDQAQNKISINYKGGLSSLKVGLYE